MDGQARIEQVGEPDPSCLGGEAEQRPVGVEGPRWATGIERESILVRPVQQLATDLAGRPTVDAQLEECCRTAWLSMGASFTVRI